MKGYYSSNRKCRKCSRKLSLEVILTICFVVVVGISFVFHILIFHKLFPLNDLSIGFAIIYHILGSYLLKYRLYNEFLSQLTVQLKIIIATFQIVASSSYVLSVNYPDYFTSFAEILAVMIIYRMMISKLKFSICLIFIINAYLKGL